jgi:hypothetical protein
VTPLPPTPAPGADDVVLVAAIVPCKDEADRIAATVRAVQGIPEVTSVLVVDDGSSDETSARAHDAGAQVIRHERNQGKAAALSSGLAWLRMHQPEVDCFLFVDGDLQESAAALGVLVPDVVSGEAAMTIATLPPQKTSGGGHGFVVRLARDGIRELTGWEPRQPLSGMRCLSSAAVDVATPLAKGWGVEVGLTVDVLRAGLPVLEVPCELHHRVTGSDWRGQVHRAKQYRDVLRALFARGLRPATVGRAVRGGSPAARP